MVSRFENVIDSNIVALKNAAENVNTQCDETAVDKNPQKLLPEELNKVLEQFYAPVHLKGKDNNSLSIIKDREYFS